MRSMHCVTALACFSLLFTSRLVAAEKPAGKDPDDQVRRTAVALNYCKAAFHRIRANPIKPVLMEERDNILNNLDFTGVDDPEVISLYTSVLNEISQVELADRELEMFRAKHRRDVLQKVAANTFTLTALVAEANFVSAVRLGANSWWDYRSQALARDTSMWKVEKALETQIVSKSSQFFDTFWKLAQKKKIPDKWLIRRNDLDALDKAMAMSDQEARLRVLDRMEHKMTCYPPYWYYVARTQQSLGQYFAAVKTYEKLADLSTGHFRKDDMLMASLANRAAIQESLGQPGASETALMALKHSTTVWEGNLMCASVLARHGNFDEAEDAILRNIDVDLEVEQSTAALASVYYHAGELRKLAGMLNDEQRRENLSVPLLMMCAARLGPEATPDAVRKTINDSFSGSPRLQYGPDDFVLVARSNWKMEHLKSITIRIGDKSYGNAKIVPGKKKYEVRFEKVAELGHPFLGRRQAIQPTITMQFPETPTIRVSLSPDDVRVQQDVYRVANVDFGTHRLTMHEESRPERGAGVRPVDTATQSNRAPSGPVSPPGLLPPMPLKVAPIAVPLQVPAETEAATPAPTQQKAAPPVPPMDFGLDEEAEQAPPATAAKD